MNDQTPAWNDQTDGRTEGWQADAQASQRDREQREQSENWEARTRGRRD